MGGQAFAKSGPNGSPLQVPRMPPHVYKEMALKVQSKLHLFFQNVTIPREAPGKLDHGDIDFLVEGALCPSTPNSIKEAIGATYFVDNGATTSYAVPYPESPDHYVQVDVERCPGDGTLDSTELFRWTKFVKSDSDLLQIIGICHRSLGITCNDRGLHVRVEEIEPYHRKKSLLFLTREPNEAMAFYGLDTSKYWAGFQTEQELFEWVVKGRFFSREIFEEREEKSNDRSRLKKRPMYNRFVEEFMPTHQQAEGHDRPWSRRDVLEEALTKFDKHEEYNAMMEEHKIREKDIAIWKRVKESLQSIPLEGKPLATTLRGLRRWVDFSDGKPFITTDAMIPDGPTWGALVLNEEEVLTWISQNWEEVKAREKARASATRAATRAASKAKKDG